MARTFHTFDTIVIGSAAESSGMFRELLRHSQNIMFIDIATQEKFLHHADALAKEAIQRNKGSNAGFKGFMKQLRNVWQEFEQKAKDGWRGIEHYRVSGEVAFEGAQSVRLNGKLLHAKSIIIQPGSEAVLPKEAGKRPKGKWLTVESLAKLKSTPQGICVEGETELARLLRALLKEVGLLQETELDECTVVIATEQRPTLRSLHPEKTKLELDENGIPRVNASNRKASAANFFVLRPDGNAEAHKKIFPVLIPLLN